MTLFAPIPTLPSILHAPGDLGKYSELMQQTVFLAAVEFLYESLAEPSQRQDFFFESKHKKFDEGEIFISVCVQVNMLNKP